MSLSVLLHCPGSERPWAREREAAGEQERRRAGRPDSWKARRCKLPTSAGG